jgi:hypothetical protein
MTSAFDINRIPSFDKSVRAKWAPVVLEPIAGSYERLVVAVAVVGPSGFHIEAANALERLICLYADGAEGVAYAIKLSVEQLNIDLARRSIEALTNPIPAITGVQILDCREAEGRTLKDIGVSWMLSLSSLYKADSEEAVLAEDIPAFIASEERERGGDRLPILIFDYVKDQKATFARYFSPEVQQGRRRRPAGKNHEVIIDFAGSKLVANFGTLQAGGVGRSVTQIKRRLWDLKVDRDDVSNQVFGRRHELILQAPRDSDPQFSERQHQQVREALAALERQADQEELRLRALSSVEEIGNHIIELEAA